MTHSHQLDIEIATSEKPNKSTTFFIALRTNSTALEYTLQCITIDNRDTLYLESYNRINSLIVTLYIAHCINTQRLSVGCVCVSEVLCPFHTYGR